MGTKNLATSGEARGSVPVRRRVQRVMALMVAAFAAVFGGDGHLVRDCQRGQHPVRGRTVHGLPEQELDRRDGSGSGAGVACGHPVSDQGELCRSRSGASLVRPAVHEPRLVLSLPALDLPVGESGLHRLPLLTT